MQANPDKFQAIAVGKNTYAKEPVFNIESANTSCDEVVKLLVVQCTMFNKVKNIVYKMLKSKGLIMEPLGTPFCKICQPLTTP
jgi:hypothetical protein